MTSSTVIADPSWNLTPCRILSVYVRPSSLTVYDSARFGQSFWSFSQNCRSGSVTLLTARPETKS